MARKASAPAISTRSYRLADGSLSRTYSVRYFDRGGIRRRVACASLEEADFERARIVLEQSRAVVADAPGPAPERSLTVAEFWPTWLADARSRLRRSTVREYERIYKTRLAERFGGAALDGLRPGEALALEVRHLRERTILVEQALSDGELKAQKTGRQYRTVDLLAVLADELREWLQSSGVGDPEALVFARPDGQAWRSDDWNNWRNRRFHPAAQAAGLGRPRPYDLRHSFAWLLIREQRTSIVELAEQLGHAPTMTLNTYAHVFAEHRREQPVDVQEWIARAREAAARPSERPRAGDHPAGKVVRMGR